MKSVWVINGLNDGGDARVFTSKAAAIDYAVKASCPVDLNVESWNRSLYTISSVSSYLEVRKIDLNPKAEWDGYSNGERLT
jgi:hypothetical protein